MVSLTKIEEKAPGLLSLAKTAVKSLEDYGLNGKKAKVALMLDFSGSIRKQYTSGNMQRLAEKALVLGTQLDDDGAIDFFTFDTTARYHGEITLDNYVGAVDKYTAGKRMGTTDYAAAMRLIRDHYKLGGSVTEKRGLFGRKTVTNTTGPAEDPIYVIFLTDGGPDSKAEAIKAIIDVSTAPIFFKFLSIGKDNFEFLEKLDTLPGRFIDNANYHAVGDVDTISDAKLFDILLDEYPDWLTLATQKGLI